MKHINLVLLCFLCLPFTGFRAQQTYNLQTCLKEALQNNHNLKKSRFDKEKSEQSRKEVLGALLPQVSGSASLTDNIQKTKFIMPNFMNKFLPASMVDPNAADYMEIEMGLTYQAGVGVALNQQLLNLSLFNAVKIAQTAQQLAVLGHESKEEDIISQTASLYYAIQVTRYTVDQFDKSLSLMDNMLETMNASYDNGIIRKVDMDRLKVAKSNLETQKNAIMSVLEVQKNLLKLQMGREMDQPVSVEPIDLAFFERQSEQPVIQNFDLNQQAPYRLMMQQKTIGELQKKSALYESMPVVTFTMNYNYNYLGNDFLKSDYSYPSALAMINLKVPIFSGLSRTAKLKQASYEQQKIKEDIASLEQSLNMAYLNALRKLEDSRQTIDSQKKNMKLAQDVYDVTEANYQQGIASMSDVLNASSSLIQSQVNYASALSDCMKAYIDLKKANGSVRELVTGF